MSDWYLSQLARQDQYGDTPPANWPVPQMPEQPEERDPFEAAALRVRAPYRNTAPVGSNLLGQLAEQVTSMPSWADVATQQMNKDKEAFQTGGIGSLLADTSVAQELAGGFGGTTKAVGKPAIGELASPFYSAAGRAVDNAKLGKGTGEQWLGYLRNQPGVKPEELNYVFGNLPEGQLTKAQMQAHAAENAVTLGEKSLGDNTQLQMKLAQDVIKERAQLQRLGNEWDAAQPLARTQIETEMNLRHDRIRELENESAGLPERNSKYDQWQLPGGENYRETLLTLPQKSKTPDLDQLVGRGEPTFRSSHWDEPNVLAHVRTNDREIPGVGKSLHVEEIQSDWHQKGRSSGYQTNKIPTADDVELKFIKGNPPADAVDKSVYPGYWESIDKSDGSMIGRHRGDMTEAEALAQAIGDLKHKARNTGVPDAPFKSTWADVALKRQIREASEKGYDAISWTPGEAQAARYDLSKHISDVELHGTGDNLRLSAFDKNGRVVVDMQHTTRQGLADHIGKEAAEKLLAQAEPDLQKNPYAARRLANADLKVGGEGMRAFYDKMLVDKANAIGKKHGARVEQSSVPVKEKFEGGVNATMLMDDLGIDRAVQERHWRALPGPQRDILIERYRAKHGLEKQEPVHVLRITPELRAAAMKGFPLFTAGGVVAGGTIGELARQDKYGRNE